MSAAKRAAKSGGIKAFLIELAVYAVFVFIYYTFVLHHMGGWLQTLFHSGRRNYAITALLLMIGQTVVLGLVTSSLVRLVRRVLD
jgi:hypothetical protein